MQTKRRVLIGFTGLLALLLLSHRAVAAEAAVSIESAVIFNTLCAKCHEAECSGRLSFDDGFGKWTSHIRRHYAPATGKIRLQQELFGILDHMKRECAYFPMKVRIPPERVWGEDILDKLATSMEKHYFIPVGEFSPGKYRIELELGRNERVTIQLISADFEMATEDCHLSENRKINVPVFIEKHGNYYLRMYPREPVKLERLAISPL